MVHIILVEHRRGIDKVAFWEYVVRPVTTKSLLNLATLSVYAAA